jgi:hypothetical protein
MSGGDASKNLTAKGAKAPPPRLKFWPSTDSSPSQKAGVAAAVRRGIGMAAPLQEASMITVYHSTVLDYPVDRVWSLIRDFNNYPAYIDGVTASVIEDNKRGDEVGAVRRFKYGDNWIRQRLSEHSDTQRTLTYRGIELFAFPAGRMDDPPAPIRYEGTIHLLPIVDDNRTFIEWPVTLHTTPGEEEAWQELFLSWIPEWTESLRRALARQ